MKTSPLILLPLVVLSIAGVAAKKVEPAKSVQGVYTQIVTDMDGKPAPLSAYAGKVAMIVNTASRCGFTPQYEGLQALQAKYRDKGFVVLGFPSNDFMWQEPGSNSEIKLFCQKNYKVDFPLFNKDHVKGSEKQALYKYLTEGPQAEFHGEIGWNFEKFLIGRDGRIVGRYKSGIAPDDGKLTGAIEAELGKAG